jgi:hypothetical protein
MVTIDLWPKEEIEAYVAERVELHRSVEDVPDDDLPFCTPHERWEKPTIFAVMKEGRKSSLKNSTNLNDAQAFLEKTKAKKKGKFYIERRLGTSPRCDDYCSIAPYCNQRKLIQQEMKEKI